MAGRGCACELGGRKKDLGCHNAPRHTSELCGRSLRKGGHIYYVAGSGAQYVGFIDALLYWLVANLCIDEERVHLTGLSNGAMMTYQLASSHVGNRIASIVPVAGLPLLGFLDPEQGQWSAVPVRPIAVMDIHGLLDHVGRDSCSTTTTLHIFRRLLRLVLRCHCSCAHRSRTEIDMINFVCTVPANVSNGFLGQPGPAGSTWSSDGFYYTPLDNVTQVYAQVNRCGERDPSAVYETAHDGELYWSCTH